MSREAGITGRMTELYDVFVDWPGRLGRELPGLERHLGALGEPGSPLRVLDVGCGTGRHVGALLERGHDAHGADASADMLARARAAIGASGRVHAWRLGEPPPGSLTEGARFDAVISMGNVWPSVLSEAEVSAACAGVRQLLRPGGLLVMGLKVHAVRQRTGQPYLPLLKRVHKGLPMWFVRFVDFDVPALADGTEVCELHIAVVRGGAADADAEGQAEPLLHRVGRQRVWRPAALGERLTAEGFEDVRVSGRLDDREVPVEGDDAFVSARVR